MTPGRAPPSTARRQSSGIEGNRRFAASFAFVLAVVAALALSGQSGAARDVRFGIQDDAWLMYGPGSVDERAAILKGLGADVVRFTLDWREIAPRRPADARDGADPAYDWSLPDAVLGALDARGLTPVVNLWDTPAWANGQRAGNWAPVSKWSLASFAYAAAQRYPFVRYWIVWNEPNQRRSLRPTSPRLYTRRLLNPAYTAIKLARHDALVGGGATAPRAATGGVSPVAWIEGMRAAHAKLDAYAHHPYPVRAGETPLDGGCGRCETITMATLDRLIRDVRSSFGSKTRIWLTEYGYQTNPPDRLLGVSKALQARYVGEAAWRSYKAPNVDMLIHYLYRDEPAVDRWQSGFVATDGAPKPARRAFMVVMAQAYRRGTATAIWGQVRNGEGRRFYALQELRRGRWRTVNGAYRTTERGFFYRYVQAGKGEKFRVIQTTTGTVSPILVIR